MIIPNQLLKRSIIETLYPKTVFLPKVEFEHKLKNRIIRPLPMMILNPYRICHNNLTYHNNSQKSRVFLNYRENIAWDFKSLGLKCSHKSVIF